jgi:hypothetical protein
MAFLGIFGKKSDAAGIRKHGDRVANKRAQAYDRWESIQALAQIKSKESVEALLPRFTFYVEPSITDQEEKDAVFSAIVESGAVGIDPVVAFMRRVGSISWAIKILDKIAPPDLVVGHLLALLATMDIEYERDPERKNQILTTLSDRKDPRIEAAVVRFLGDMNETVRFNTVAVLSAQDAIALHRDAVIACLCTEDSVRVRNRIFEALAAAAISVKPQEEQVKARLTQNYTLDVGGVPKRKSA